MRTHHDCRDRVIALRTSMSKAVATRLGNNNTPETDALTKLVVTVEADHQAAADTIADYLLAPAFFSTCNVDRIARWAASRRDFDILLAKGGFVIRPPERDDISSQSWDRCRCQGFQHWANFRLRKPINRRPTQDTYAQTRFAMPHRLTRTHGRTTA